ncbi:TGB1 [Robigovirus elaeis]|uniref:TGB1 n=1 Tax=Robigovirus elaeis TaxID=185218 RepID=C1BEF9_9VIRU|nr:TGB1 [African oil palm ringspot virus]ACO38636.1 TGB1 [African oil palm ringspot virus]
MEEVCEKLLELGYIRVESVSISYPIVVHGVPGCGKSFICKELAKDPKFKVQSFGVIPAGSLCGAVIHKALTEPSGDFNVLDEYLGGKDFNLERFDLVLSDPYQSFKKPERAHFTSNITRRFGSQVCCLLNKLGFDIIPHPSLPAEQTLLIEGSLFKTELRGIIITFEPAVAELIRAHGLEPKHPCDVRGAEFEVVTFCTAHADLQEIVSPELYISLTRATKELRVLTNKFDES